MKIPLIDLVAQYRSIRGEIDTAISSVLESGTFILGPNVAAFEEEMAAYLGVRHAVGVASGTDALLLALRAFGIGPGDEIVVPAYTFFATAEAVMQAGATPVFVDIDPKTYCLDAAQLEAKITSRTKGMIPVHLYGHPADMEPILEIAKLRELRVIEDNAQAIGAEYKGRKVGTIGDAGCLSFFPSKNLGGYGDGGMVITNDDEVAECLRMMRTHGWRKKYYPERMGYNSRLDELQAAVLRVKLRHLDAWNERRRELARQYAELLSGLGVRLAYEAPYVKHVYHLYVISVQNRDEVQGCLRKQGIDSGVYYPQPLHLARPCWSLGFSEGDFPFAERASCETLAIPLYPEMSDEHLWRVRTAMERAMTMPEVRPQV